MRQLLRCGLLVLVVIWLAGLQGPAYGADDWSSVREKLERARSETGRQEVARDVGLAWAAERLDEIGLTAEALDFIEEGNHPVAKAFGKTMTALGGASLLLELARDLKERRGSFDTTVNLLKNCFNLGVDLAAPPAVKAVVWTSQLLKRRADALVESTFKGDPALWWPVYEKFFTEPPGALSPDGWLALFKNGDESAYIQHMDNFFTEAGIEFTEANRNAFARRGIDLPKLAKADRWAVKTHAEAFRLRFYKEHLQNKLAEWAFNEAQQLMAREVEKAKAATEALVKNSIIAVRVQDSSDGTPVRGAWVQATWKEGRDKKQAHDKTGEKGQTVLKGVPPWADGELSIEKSGYTTWKDSPLNRSLSTVDTPQEITVDLVPDQVKVRIQIIDAVSGQPLANVRLVAKPRGRGNEVSGTTSGNGSTELVFPKEGEYTFTLSAPDQPAYEEVRTVRAGSPDSPVDMVFRLNVAAGITIEALVKDARTGAALPGVVVTGTAGSEHSTATTGADGTARIVLTRATSKTAAVTCTREGYAKGTGSGSVDKGLARVTVAMEPAGGLVRIIIREGKEGKGVAGVTATVSPGDVSGVTGPDGSVELAVPIAPTVSVTCTKGSLPPMRRSCEMVDGKAQITFLVNIETIPLKVRVGDKVTKAPLQGVKVKAVVNGADFFGSTDADGNLTMEIAAGESVKVYLYKPGYKTIEVTKKIEGKLVTVGGTLTPEGTAILQITLKNRSNSQPLPGATVTAGDQTARTNAKGVAEIEVLPGQALQITASLDGFQPRRESGTAPAAGATKKVGWFLEPLASQSPTPTLPAKASAGGGNTPFCGVYRGKFRYNTDVDCKSYGYRTQPQFVKGIDTTGEFMIEIVRMVSRSNPNSKDYPWDGLYEIRVRIHGSYPNQGAKLAMQFSGEADLQWEIGGSGINDTEIQFGFSQPKLQKFIFDGRSGEASFNFYKEPGKPCKANIWYGTDQHAGQLQAVFDR